MAGTDPSPLVRAARDLAQVSLQPLPARWRHTIGVAHRAGELTQALDDEEPDILTAAAWLHDIGYSPTVADLGFHPLDGARYLDRLGWPARINALVTHHSGAAYIAKAQGLGAELDAYPDEATVLSDALTYADQTIGPDGRRVGLDDRLAEALRRHGSPSPYAAAHEQREPYLRDVARRVEGRLAAADSPES